MENAIKIVFAIIAALIGAGFASGQEINVFFYSYGAKGILGLIVCSILMCYIIYSVLKLIIINDINSYKDFVYLMVGHKSNRRFLNIAYIINNIINLFLIISFFIMIAGFGAYFSQEMGIYNYFGSGVLSILCFITLIRNSNEVIKINSLLIPFLIIFIVVIGMVNVTTFDIKSSLYKINDFNKSGWLVSSILYTSYNSILFVPVLITLKKHIKKKTAIFVISIISGIIIFLLAISIYLLLTRIEIDINQLEMPIIYVISNYFASFKIIYALIILTSIYTTAISIGSSVLENVAKSKKSYIQIAMFMCIIGFMVSGIGFSNLITYIYPIFGFLGLVQMLEIIKRSV